MSWTVKSQGQEKRVQIQHLSRDSITFVSKAPYEKGAEVMVYVIYESSTPPAGLRVLRMRIRIKEAKETAPKTWEYTCEYLEPAGSFIAEIEKEMQTESRSERANVLETRRAERRQLQIKVWSHDLSDFQALSRDISVTGAKLVTNQEMFVGESLSLVLEFDDDRLPPLECMGTVVWYNGRDSTVGVRFVGMSELDQEAIDSYLQLACGDLPSV